VAMGSRFAFSTPQGFLRVSRSSSHTASRLQCLSHAGSLWCPSLHRRRTCTSHPHKHMMS
jgi:hypothetical protein